VRDRRCGIVLRLIEPGAFLMGAPDADREATDVERPRHRVQLTRPYWLAETEVTWEQWRVFAAETGAGGGLEAASARHPVAGLSWVQAERFCQHFGLRLPTEAEWEYAARAGGSEPYRRFAWGDDPRQAVGNFYGADEARRDDDVFLIRDGFVGAAPVGTYGKNGWGLADMLGNVREWCADAFVRDAYAGRRDGAVDPRVEAGSAPTVVVRGGSFQDGPRNAGIATRLEAARDVRLPWIGLRVARDVW
jgi:formylglycine-generating enzyme required for sulfatase activity